MVTCRVIYSDVTSDYMELVKKELTDTGKVFTFRLIATRPFSPQYFIVEDDKLPGIAQLVQNADWGYFQKDDILVHKVEVGDEWGR